MRIIKVNATESTNTMARVWFQSNKKEEPVCIVTNHQTNGRGQRGATWVSNAGENLTFSVVFPWPQVAIQDQFLISAGVGLQIISALKELKINNLKLKWPNDIMAENYKIGGVLIENIISNNKIAASIIGIGLNINQVRFDDLPKASSIKNLTGILYSIDEVLEILLKELENMIIPKSESYFTGILKKYENTLFRKNKASTFQLKDGSLLTGIILGVTSSGLLKVQVEDEALRIFDLKELKLLF